MSDVRPRVGKRRGVGRTLLCGFPTCDGTVGGLVFTGLRRVLPVPFRPHPGSVALRDLVEAQAPAGALVAALWVVPEGFCFDAESEVWRSTRRGAERRRLMRRGHGVPMRRATHGPRPQAGGEPTYAAAIPLPGVVICPQGGCGRRNRVTKELLQDLFAKLAAELNDTALAIHGDPALGLRWLADHLNVSTDDLMAGLRADPTLITRLAIAIPEWRLLEAAQAGFPASASDFFAVDLPRSWMAPRPDAS